MRIYKFGSFIIDFAGFPLCWHGSHRQSTAANACSKLQLHLFWALSAKLSLNLVAKLCVHAYVSNFEYFHLKKKKVKDDKFWFRPQNSWEKRNCIKFCQLHFCKLHNLFWKFCEFYCTAFTGQLRKTNCSFSFQWIYYFLFGYNV